MPLQRMANVSLQPAPGGPSADKLIAGVENGIYILGDKSWSIDIIQANRIAASQITLDKLACENRALPRHRRGP
jgi:predicted Zn-dependent protease